MRKFLTLGLLCASGMAGAQTADGVIVRTSDAEKTFVISEIKEITFGDEAMTVVKTDETTVEFSGDWQISFGEIEASGIAFAELQQSDKPVEVYNAEGKLVLKKDRLSQLRLADLPKGVYIIKCDGKSIKIR